MVTVAVMGRLPSLNEYIAVERSNKYKAAKMKKVATATCAFAFVNLKPIPKNWLPVNVLFNWYCKNKRRDPDNIAFAKKFIFDGMVTLEFLPGDGWGEVASLKDNFYIDTKDWVEIVLTPFSE